MLDTADPQASMPSFSVKPSDGSSNKTNNLSKDKTIEITNTTTPEAAVTATRLKTTAITTGPVISAALNTQKHRKALVNMPTISMPNTTPLPKVTPTAPIQIPKVINTPEGTIPLNSNINNSMKKSTNNNSKTGHFQSNPNKTTVTAAQRSSNSTTKLLLSAPLSRSSANASVSNINVLTSKNSKFGPVPIKPNPNTAPSIQFHPIAIKPKPKSLQTIPNKIRPKSISLSRTASATSPLKKEIPLTNNTNSTITLSTSKNWVLPPRPKTKKVSKKKEKKVVKNNVSDIGLAKTGPVTVKKLPLSATASAIASPASIPSNSLGSSPNLNVNTAVSKSTSNTKSKSTEKAAIGINSAASKLKTAGSDTSTNKCTSPKCTGCSKVCIANGIRSVYKDKTTGKVLINAQIHSNINLYTNNEKELEVQLQHVTRENDNLKKILLKLNKEIQNLRIAKKKEELNSQSRKKIKTVKSETIKDNNVEKTSTPIEINLPKIKEEKLIPVDFGFAETTVDANNVAKPTPNTINPVNLSYNANNEKKKVTGVSLELKQAKESLPQPAIQESKKVASKAKSKPKAKIKAKATKAKEYHSCGVCEINQKCICFEKQSKSIASGIAQVFSRGNTKVLGIGNQSGVGAMKSTGTVSTLATMLQREDIMKKLKSDDKKNLKGNTKSPIAFDAKTEDLDMNNDMLFKSNDFTSLNMKADKDTLNDVEMMETANFDDEDNLLQMIDAELLLDPTPIIPSKLVKTSNSLNTRSDETSTSMKKSDSKNSVQNSMDYFNRGTLMDFNPFNSNDMMIHDDFDESSNDKKFNEILKNNDTPITGADHENNDSPFQSALLFENCLHNGDDFMMY